MRSHGLDSNCGACRRRCRSGVATVDRRRVAGARRSDRMRAGGWSRCGAADRRADAGDGFASALPTPRPRACVGWTCRWRRAHQLSRPVRHVSLRRTACSARWPTCSGSHAEAPRTRARGWTTARGRPTFPLRRDATPAAGVRERAGATTRSCASKATACTRSRSARCTPASSSRATSASRSSARRCCGWSSAWATSTRASSSASRAGAARGASAGRARVGRLDGGLRLGLRMALESAAGCRSGARAWLRALMLERERVANHLGDLGALGNDAALAFGLAQFSRLREDWQRACAEVFGHRLLMDRWCPAASRATSPRRCATTCARSATQLEREVRRLRRSTTSTPGCRTAS